MSKRWWEASTAKSSSPVPLTRVLRVIWIYPRATISEFMADNCTLLAAAIAFYGLLSIVPLLLIGLASLGLFLESSDRAVEEIFRLTQEFLPRGARRILQEAVSSLIEKRGLAGGLGFLSLLWIGNGAFECIEQAVNLIYEAAETRGFFHRKLVSLLLMVLTGGLLFSALVLSSIATAIRALGGRFLTIFPFSLFQEISTKLSLVTWKLLLALIPLFLVIVMFALIYAIAPTKKIPFGSIVVGSVVAGLLWQLTKAAYSWYIVHYAGYDRIYGPLGAFIGLILWIYYSAIILLLGAEVAWANYKARVKEREM